MGNCQQERTLVAAFNVVDSQRSNASKVEALLILNET